ncbi:MAG: hypothetical protein OXH52_06080 [Gammaproteobacteria bacterium]|nr:hypothetical protein [Gammaproteobacteria bacterium]
MARRDDFGMKTTCADELSRAPVEHATTTGYRIRAYFIGTRRRRSTSSGSTAGSRPTQDALRRHRLGPWLGPWVDP